MCRRSRRSATTYLRALPCETCPAAALRKRHRREETQAPGSMAASVHRLETATHNPSAGICFLAIRSPVRPGYVSPAFEALCPEPCLAREQKHSSIDSPLNSWLAYLLLHRENKCRRFDLLLWRRGMRHRNSWRQNQMSCHCICARCRHRLCHRTSALRDELHRGHDCRP